MTEETTPNEKALEEFAGAIWEAILVAHDAYVADTGGPRPIPRVPWSDLAPPARDAFIVCVAQVLPDVTDGVAVAAYKHLVEMN